MKKSSLVLIPSPRISGGVSSYYQSIRPHVHPSIRFMVRGRRMKARYADKIILLLCYVLDVVLFLGRIPWVNRVVINHSLGKEAIYRDALYIKVARAFRKEVVVFFRGLDPKVQEHIEKGKFPVFNNTFLKADKLVILSKAFEKKLTSWGYTGQIVIETTVIDDQLMEYAAAEKDYAVLNILFLSRVEKYKGVFELLDAFEMIQQKLPHVHLTVAGSGGALDSAKQIAREKALKNIHFPGHVSGEAKAKAYTSADLYILPSYAEGLPNALLEAMAFGLSVVITPVGGVPDIFIDKQNGLLLNSTEPSDIFEKTMRLLESEQLRERIGVYNKANADIYYASNVAKRFNTYFACQK